MREPRNLPPPTPDAGDQPLPRRTRDQVTINISLRTIAIVVAIWLAFWVVRELASTLLLFAGAILIATAVDRPAVALERQGVPRAVSILILLALVVGLLVAVIAVLVPLISKEVDAFQTQLTDYEAQLQNALNQSGARVDLTHRLGFDQLVARLSDNMGTIASGLTSLTLQVSHVAVLVFAMLVIAFMLAMNPSAGARFAARFLAEPTLARLLRISNDVHQRIGGWVRGQVLVAVTFGLAFGAGLWIIGIPYATSLGLAAGVLELIPYLGGAVTVILATAIALTISVPHAVLVVVLYVVLINIESHVLAPKFIGDAVGLPPVVVLGALLIGLEWKGILGVLLAVPAVLVLAAIVDEFWPAPETPSASEAGHPPGIIQRIARYVARFRPRGS
jgi:predicted PurR-regulated permease PerM